jgi:hypothetical protein
MMLTNDTESRRKNLLLELRLKLNLKSLDALAIDRRVPTSYYEHDESA